MHNFSGLDEYDKEEDKIGMKLQQPRNNAPSNLQITAEQIIKESQAHRTDEINIPIQRISDEDELNDYKLKKRKEFEDQIRRQRYNIGCWLKYASWEERQTEFTRARSIYERAIEIDFKNVSLWLRYAEMEMKNKFINHARNIWERACQLLPRIEQFWYKWSYMEEMLGNYSGAREVFRAWMTWKPGDLAWVAFSKFEERMGQIDNARCVLYMSLNEQKTLKSYLRVARFEEKHNNLKSAREVYERALKELPSEEINEGFLMQFIKFEMKNKEYDRCRTLFAYGLENIDEKNNKKLYSLYVKFEKKYGNKKTYENIVITKRRLFYIKELEKNSLNYDLWFDYSKLEEDYGSISSCREVYEKAISNVPPIKEKKYWRRYIFLWLNYAIFEEVYCENINKAEEIYRKLLNLIPHQLFTFSKIWILFAQFYFRNKQIEKARKVFGMAISEVPKEKILESYIYFETQLGNIERVRKIYQSFIEKVSENSNAWIKYALFEKSLEERERCESIFENAINLPLDRPEKVWRAYILTEISYNNYDKAKSLYERLLKKTKHIKVWLSYAKFESEFGEIENMRMVYKRAIQHCNDNHYKEERNILIEDWIKNEKDDFDKKNIEEMLTKKVQIESKDNDDINTNKQSIFDYSSIKDNRENQELKILENALKWKEEMKKEGEEN